jgi:hypothetical protein
MGTPYFFRKFDFASAVIGYFKNCFGLYTRMETHQFTLESGRRLSTKIIQMDTSMQIQNLFLLAIPVACIA